jgi:predicted acyltransferase
MVSPTSPVCKHELEERRRKTPELLPIRKASAHNLGMSTKPEPSWNRLASIDAYRGLVMFLMMAEVLHLADVSRRPPGRVWDFLGHNQTHVHWATLSARELVPGTAEYERRAATGAWIEWSLHDMIQPSFSFLVGVALPFSIASRLARGQTFGRMLAHAGWRALLLILLGVFLRSGGHPKTNWTFEDTLSQIGFGYVFLFLLGFCRPRWQWLALLLILAGYWAAFALYPAPGPEFDWKAVGVEPNWAYNYQGFASHWNKNSNFAWWFDTHFLNLFSREKPFAYNGGGYSTLSFIPTLATMVLGLIAGGWLRKITSAATTTGKLLLAGLGCLALGLALDYFGICPSVKKIWTPAWTLVSGGWCFVALALFFASIDWPGWTSWSFPLRVIGMNSIVAYCMADLRIGNTNLGGFVASSIKTHTQALIEKMGESKDANIFTKLSELLGGSPSTYADFLAGVVVLLVFWLILFWMYRRKLFVRI